MTSSSLNRSSRPSNLRHAFVEPARLRAADCLQALSAGRARLRHDVQLLVAPMGWHLAPAGGGIVFRAHCREQHLVRRESERETEGAVPVVRIEPVVPRPQQHSGRGEDRLVTGAADLEEDQALALELDFLVVEPSRQQHRAVCAEQVFPADSLERHGSPLGVRTHSVADRRNFHARIGPFEPRGATDKGSPNAAGLETGNYNPVTRARAASGGARRMLQSCTLFDKKRSCWSGTGARERRF